MSVTFSVLKSETSSEVNAEQLPNMKRISVTLPVFQPERSSEASAEQLWNILFITVTLAVFHPERSSEVKLSQLWNIKLMLVTSLVLTLLKSMLWQLKLLNKLEQSPVNFTSSVAVTLVTADGMTSLPHLLPFENSPQMSDKAPVALS